MKIRFWVSIVVLLILINGCTRQNPQTEQPNATQPNSNQQLQQTQVEVPSPSPQAGTPPFLMALEEIFTIHGRGVVVTGRVERGRLKVNDPVEIVGIQPTKQTVVTGVEMFKKVLDEAVPGDNVGLLLRGLERRDIERGQVVATPGSIKPHTKFKATVDMLKKEEGGRHIPIFTGYQPQFYFRTRDVPGELKLPAGTEMITPGDSNKPVEVELKMPIALEEGLRFFIREGGRTVATGIVTGIIE